MPVTTSATALDRGAVLERFARIRARTRDLFSLVRDEAYYSRPIALRNPVVFYEGHLPAFAVNTLLKKALGQPGIDEHLETIPSARRHPSRAGTRRGPIAQRSARLRQKPTGGLPTRFERRISSVRIIRFCVEAKRYGRFSSMRRCTRRRFSTCGINSPTT
jgi:hypothetical protein